MGTIFLISTSEAAGRRGVHLAAGLRPCETSLKHGPAMKAAPREMTPLIALSVFDSEIRGGRLLLNRRHVKYRELCSRPTEQGRRISGLLTSPVRSQPNDCVTFER